MQRVLEADRRIFAFIHGRLRLQAVDPLMVWFTKAGTKGILWLGIAFGLFIDPAAPARSAAIVSVSAMLLAQAVINLVLKPAIARERPYESPGLSALLVRAPGPHSWPSAHAGSSAAAAIVLAVAYPMLWPIFLGLALLIAYSRVYVGVHYPLDVVAGIIIGVVAAVVAILGHGLILEIVRP